MKQGRNQFGKRENRDDNRRRDYRKNDEKPVRTQVVSSKYKEEEAEEETDIRLNRYISNAGICSRRDADKLIEKGEITVNGKVVTELGLKVSVNDDIRYQNKKLNPEAKVYVLLNKPKNVVTTARDPQGRLTVLDIVESVCDERIYPVGRLDRQTTGVMLLTNDGDLSKKLTHPSSKTKKIYHVFVDKAVSFEHLKLIAEGIKLDDGFIKPDEINYVADDKTEIGIEIHSGRNRIVRRIFEHLGYNIVKLDRVYFAGLTKKNLPRGKWRFLTAKEITFLKAGILG